MRRYYGKRYSSGNAWVDWTFRRFIEVLSVVEIKIKKRLKNPEDPKKEIIRGLWDPDIHTIFLNHSKTMHETPEELLETLCHEILHSITGTPPFKYCTHKSIYRAERALVQSFSTRQKKILMRFIPKEEEKLSPAD